MAHGGEYVVSRSAMERGPSSIADHVIDRLTDPDRSGGEREVRVVYVDKTEHVVQIDGREIARSLKDNTRLQRDVGILLPDTGIGRRRK